MDVTPQGQLSTLDEENGAHQVEKIAAKKAAKTKATSTHEDMKKTLCSYVSIVLLLVFVVTGVVVGWELRLRQFDDTAQNSGISSSRFVSHSTSITI
jgi:hypothetical protein